MIATIMPHWSLVLSMTQIVLALFWVFSGNLKENFKTIFKNKAAVLLLSLYLIHIIGLTYSIDFKNGLNDLKIKLPLLLFPIVIAGSGKLKFKQLKIIILVLTGSLILKTLYGIVLLTGITGKEISEMNQLSGKISHIRFALLINISIFSVLYLLLFTNNKPKYKIIFSATVIWLSGFLFILHSLTGWVVFVVLFILTIFYLIKKSRSGVLRFAGILVGTVVLFSITFFMIHSVRKYNSTELIDLAKLETHTQSGNAYTHFTNNKQKENGRFVYLYICKKEMEEEWNKVSSIPYTGKDKLNQNIRHTLIRYLTSKGLRKDKSGIKQLSKKDIENIENGLANHIYENRYAVYPKIYEVLWQFDHYRSGGSPEGHSVTQRIEFIKTGVKIINAYVWTGVGTGGQKKAYKEQYDKSQTQLSEKHRLRAHNQYITIFITLGIFGFLWFLYAFFYLIIKDRKYKDYLFLMIFTVISLSMLNEDTIETQMGATIFAFFISLFLFSETKPPEHSTLVQTN
jgi:hypothetical protein